VESVSSSSRLINVDHLVLLVLLVFVINHGRFSLSEVTLKGILNSTIYIPTSYQDSRPARLYHTPPYIYHPSHNGT
jgi:hypothetical protein